MKQSNRKTEKVKLAHIIFGSLEMYPVGEGESTTSGKITDDLKIELQKFIKRY